MNTPNDLVAIVRDKSRISVCDATPEQMQVLFAKIYTLIGLRGQHLPTKEHDVFHIQFIKRNYGNRKLAEIYYAFEFAILGKLDLDDVKCYDQFTMEYFSRIMSAYRRYFNQIASVTQLEAKQTTLIDKPIQPTIIEEEIKEWSEIASKTIYHFPLYLYDYLVKAGKINLSNEQKFEYLDKAYKFHMNELMSEMETKQIKQLKKMYETSGIKGLTGEICTKLRTIAKRLIVQNYYRNESEKNRCQSETDNGCTPQNTAINSFLNSYNR